MKIGLFSGSLRPEEGGGYTIEKEIISAISQYKDLTHHEFVLFSWFDMPQLRRAGFEVKNIHASISEKVTYKLSEQIAKLRVGRKKDLLNPIQKKILREEVDAIFYLSPWENFFLDIPYFSMVWDLQHRLQPYFPEVSNKGEWAKREKFYSANLPQASRVIIGNEAGRNEIHQFYRIPKERIFLIPHPTPAFALENADTKPPLPQSFTPQRPYLFYPAQFWAHKNHVGLLNALHLLKRDFQQEFDLVLVGSDKGNQSFVMQKAQSLGLVHQVHCLGFVSINHLIALYQNAFALAYVTYFGPENLPPLEAFALGCPVIASRVAGADEQLGEGAILVNPSSPQEIAQAVITLANDENLKNELLNKGKKIAQERSGKAFAMKFFTMLDEFEPLRSCWR